MYRLKFLRVRGLILLGPFSRGLILLVIQIVPFSSWETVEFRIQKTPRMTWPDPVATALAALDP